MRSAESTVSSRYCRRHCSYSFPKATKTRPSTRSPRQAGLTKGAVYFYFKGKAALLHALLDDAEQLYADIFAQLKSSGVGPAEQLEMFVDWCAETGAQNQELLVLPILVSLQAMGKEARLRRT